jgi:hypothetical protein
MKREYGTPHCITDKCFETSALMCGYTADPPPGSFHFAHAYDTFTGHFGPGFGASESFSGQAGVGFGPGGTTMSYGMTGLCGNWVMFAS